MINTNNEALSFAKMIPARQIIDVVTYNKIQRHLLDINDKITEEDIRNIKLYPGKQDRADIRTALNKIPQ